MSNISITNPTILNSETSNVTKLTANDNDIVNGLTDGTKDISVSAATFASTVTVGAGNMAIEGKSVDVVRLQNSNIATSDIDTVVFDFVPSKITFTYLMSGTSADTNGPGGNSGQGIITITGTDTATVLMDNMYIRDVSSAAFSTGINVGSTTEIFHLTNGTSGGASSVSGAMTSWTTATKTLLITYTVTNCTDASNIVSAIFTAYK